jgi:hypothetical protein
LKKKVTLALFLEIDFRKVENIFGSRYRKLPLKITGYTLKGPDGTVLVTAHWVFKQEHMIFYILKLMTHRELQDVNFRKKLQLFIQKFEINY